MTLFTICITLSLISQEYSYLQDVDYIQEHEVFLKREFPHAFDGMKVEGIKKVDDKHTMIAFTMNNEYYEVVVNSERKEMLLVVKYHKISQSDAPQVVLDAAKSKYKGEITQCFEVQEPSSEEYFAVVLKKDGKKKRVYFNHLGQFKKRPV